MSLGAAKASAAVAGQPPAAAVQPLAVAVQPLAVAVEPAGPAVTAPAASPVLGPSGEPGTPAGPAGPLAPETPAAAVPGDLPCVPVVCSLGSDAVKSVAQTVLGSFASFLAQGVADVLDQVATAIDNTTKVTLDASWFQSNFDAMRSLAVLVLLPMVLVGLISAVIRRDASQLWRAGGVYIPVAILGGVLLIALTEKALAVTDWATAALTGNVTTSDHSAVAILKNAVLVISGDPSLASALAEVVLMIALFGALLIWMELLLRTAAIYVVVLFLPLAMSGLVWKGSAQWTRKMLEALVALILSKFVIVVVLALAAGMITAGKGVGTVMEGATLLMLAAAAPFALLRLVPIVEAGAIGHLEGLERRPLAAAKRAASTALQVAMLGAGSGGGALADNGGDAGAALGGHREAGGQLASVGSPDGGGSRGQGPSGGGPSGGGSTAPPPPTAPQSLPGPASSLPPGTAGPASGTAGLPPGTAGPADAETDPASEVVGAG
ncbi:MAG: hypothetical protein ACRDZ8_18775, partial [Acidimicrobiales bacterium]